MKVVFVNDCIYEYASESPAAVGGAERQQWLLARGLARAGWSVTVGVSRSMERFEPKEIEGVKFVELGRGHSFLRWYGILRSERPDWGFWRCADHWLGPAVALAKAVGVRTVFSTALDWDVEPRRALFRHPSLWPFYAWGLSWADRIVVQHPGQLASLPFQWQSKASIVPSICGTRVESRPHSQRSNYVAWVAVLRRWKRPDLLVDIARRLPSVRFVACGGSTSFATPQGYAKDVIAQLEAQPNIDFLGKVSPQKSFQVIADAALLLSTAEVEGFPNTFLEAWGCGTPVVSLSVDPGGIINQQGLGSIVGDPDRAAAEIQRLLSSSQLRDEIAHRSQGHVASSHSESAAVRALERVLRSVTGSPAGETEQVNKLQS